MQRVSNRNQRRFEVALFANLAFDRRTFNLRFLLRDLSLLSWVAESRDFQRFLRIWIFCGAKLIISNCLSLTPNASKRQICCRSRAPKTNNKLANLHTKTAKNDKRHKLKQRKRNQIRNSRQISKQRQTKRNLSASFRVCKSRSLLSVRWFGAKTNASWKFAFQKTKTQREKKNRIFLFFSRSNKLLLLSRTNLRSFTCQPKVNRTQNSYWFSDSFFDWTINAKQVSLLNLLLLLREQKLNFQVSINEPKALSFCVNCQF